MFSYDCTWVQVNDSRGTFLALTPVLDLLSGCEIQILRTFKEKEMNKNGKGWMLITLGAAVLLGLGCAGPKIQNTAVPNAPEDTKVAKAVDTPTPQSAPVVQKYTVKAGDTLWAISNQTGIYSDSFQWPEIFKTDRDQIQDPDQITPGQVLTITKDLTEQQVAQVRKLASETPTFVSHVDPRSPLPIDYF